MIFWLQKNNDPEHHYTVERWEGSIYPRVNRKDGRVTGRPWSVAPGPEMNRHARRSGR